MRGRWLAARARRYTDGASGAAASRPGSARGRAAAASDRPLAHREAFSSSGPDLDTYNPHAIESKWQQVWDAEGAFEVPNPEPGAPRNPLQALRARDAAVSVGLAAHGPHARLHARRRPGAFLSPQRLRGAAADGVRLVRPAGRERRDQATAAIRARSSSGTSTRSARTMKTIGWAIDWSRQFSTHEPEYYRWTQWLFLQLLRRRARRAPNGAGQVVPARPDGACERAGQGRTLRALRRPGRVAEHRAVVLQDDRLRRSAARLLGAPTGPSG